MNTSTLPANNTVPPSPRVSNNTGGCLGHRLVGFMQQLRDRKVCRAAAGYAILTWFILQLGEIIFPSLGLPAWTLTLAVVVAAAGFPIAMLLAWILQWTDDGLIIDLARADGSTSGSPMESVLNVALLIAAIVLSGELIFSNSSHAIIDTNTPASADTTVAVLPFSYEGPADAISDRSIEQFLRHALIRIEHYPLVTVAGLSQANLSGGTAADSLDWVIEGSVRREGDEAQLLVRLIKMPEKHYVNSWAFSTSNSSDSIKKLSTSVVRTVINELEFNRTLDQSVVGMAKNEG